MVVRSWRRKSTAGGNGGLFAIVRTIGLCVPSKSTAGGHGRFFEVGQQIGALKTDIGALVGAALETDPAPLHFLPQGADRNPERGGRLGLGKEWLVGDHCGGHRLAGFAGVNCLIYSAIDESIHQQSVGVAKVGEAFVRGDRHPDGRRFGLSFPAPWFMKGLHCIALCFGVNVSRR